MKAIRIHQYGGPDVVRWEEAPRPQAGPDEVLVRVRAAGVNPVDWKIREGWLSEMVPYQFPLILGCDVAGIVEQSNAPQWKPGDEVFAMPGVQGGAFAEYIALPGGALARKPTTLNFAQAAAVPVVALTAWQALFDHANLQPQQRVLIHAAAGGVGSFGVQIARWQGAQIFATASARNRDFVKNLGADEVIDYTAQRFEEIARDCDVVLDCAGGETQERSFACLKPGGILVSVVSAPDDDLAQQHNVRTAVFMARSDAAQLTQIARLIDEGRVQVPLTHTFALAQAHEALEQSATRHTRGKIVLEIE